MPSPQGDFIVFLWPDLESSVLYPGAGRLDTRDSVRVVVEVATRLAGDEKQSSAEWLLNQKLGHLRMRHRVFDAFVGFWPTDVLGPVVTLSGGGGTGCFAGAVVTAGALDFVKLGGGGTGYTAAPTVTIQGGGGSGATAAAILTDDSVSAISVLTGGSGYAAPNTLTDAPLAPVSGGKPKRERKTPGWGSSRLAFSLTYILALSQPTVLL